MNTPEQSAAGNLAWDLISRGEVNQLEPFSEECKRFAPRSIEELSMMLALATDPITMQAYLAARDGSETHRLFIFQAQILEELQDGGFGEQESLDAFKAMAKRRAGEVSRLRSKFIAGSSDPAAGVTFDAMAARAPKMVPATHAAAYAMEIFRGALAKVS